MPHARGPGATAAAYHEATKHTSASVRRRRHLLDWDNLPHLFKTYEGLPAVPLPGKPPRLGGRALDAIAAVGGRGESGEPDLEGLTRILTYGAGVIRQALTSWGELFYFRTYASAGALYPVEIYLACAELSGLPAGVYHFNPKDAALVRLREGDHRAFLVRAAAGEPAVAAAPAVLVLSGIPGRTGWKYTERGYRHLFWDAGTILANLLALAASAKLRARVVMGFVDSEVEALLGVDGRRELPLCLLALGSGEPVEAASRPPEPVALPEGPIFRGRAIEFPSVLEVNDAGRLRAGRVGIWRKPAPEPAPVPGGNPTRTAPAEPATASLESVIRRRGSARSFEREPVPAGVLAAVLDRATRGIPTDVAPTGSRLAEPYLIANAVEGLPPGAYAWRDGGFLLLAEGQFRAEAGYLCLEQGLAADAAAVLFLMAGLDGVLAALGDRGYRAAQLEGGIVAGKLYLGAHAYGLAATGLTFYDDDVRAFFSPHAAGKSCLLVVAIGQSRRRLLPLAREL